MSRRLGLFQGYGVELETMVVSRETLDVLPVVDRLLAAEGGEGASDVFRGDIAWSNELVLHVVEFKTNGPAAALEGLPDRFLADLRRAEEVLAPWGARLLPTAMHPWMDPAAETRLWPGDSGEVYRAFDRIFGCRGHGWANLQSMHLNLPFRDDREFARLHAGVRALLPLLPALAASSPFVEGRATGWMDNRLRYYRENCRRVPAVTGQVVPEPVDSRARYEREILGAVYDGLAPHDPEGVLRYEWANARGAIARFDRHAIEIRVIDVQEGPASDLAIAAAVRSVLRFLADGRRTDRERLDALPTERLSALLLEVAKDADRAVVADRAYLAALGLPDRGPLEARDAWRALLEAHLPAGTPESDPWRGALATILDEGPLARRILAATGTEPSRGRLRETYRRLADSLGAGRTFHG